MGCAGNQISIDNQVTAAYNAGFRGDDIPIIVSIAQAESCEGHEKSTNVDNQGNQIMGILQISSVNGVSPDCAFDYQCAYKAAYKIKQQQGFCAWQTYNVGCGPDHYPSYLNYFQSVASVVTRRQVAGTLSQGLAPDVAGNTGLEGVPVIGGVNTAVKAVGNTAQQAASGFQNLGTGLEALTKPFQAISQFFSSPKAAFARILLFILGIFIAFEAVKHLGGSNSNLAVVGTQNAGKAAFGKKVAETAEIA